MLELCFDLARASERFDLAGGVAEENVAPSLLKVPGSYQNRVPHLDPDPTFHLSPDPADPAYAVCALHQNPVVSEKLFYCAV